MKFFDAEGRSRREVKADIDWARDNGPLPASRSGEELAGEVA
jgi:hypothetical protein